MGLALSACAEQPFQLPEPLEEPEAVQREDSRPDAGGPDQGFSRAVRLPVLQVAKWDQEADPRWESLVLPEGDFVLNVDAMPLGRFIHVSLGEVLGLSFDIDPEVARRQDMVTLRISKAVSARRMMGMVEQTLAGFSVGLAFDEGHLRILPSSKLDSLPPTPVALGSLGLPITPGRVITILPLSYILPGEVLNFARYYLKLGSGAEVFSMQRLNAVLVIGDPIRIERFAQVVAMVDRPSMSDRHLHLIKTIYWKSDEIAELLQDALRAQGVRVAAEADQPGTFVSSIDRLNAMLIAAPNRETVKWIIDWVGTLDTPEAAGDSVQSFIYFVKHSTAEDLGDIVRQLLGPEGSAGSQSSSPPGEDENAGGGGSASVSSLGNAGLRMVVDETRNSLVFVGSAAEYAVAYKLLKELDIPAKQVLIEVTVADVSLDKTRNLGVEWRYADYNSNGEVTRLIRTAGLGVGNAGLLATSIDSQGQVEFRLNALVEEGDARILSSPKLLALDNEEARIQVGEQVAVITSEVGDTASATVGQDNVIRSFTYVDTGIILTFKPTVMADGVVQLDIYQEVSSAGPSLNNTPPISKRTVETTMIAHSGQTVMIGGLITRNSTQSESKVPLLGDLPGLGGLFKSTSVTNDSSELIVLITPHVIESAEQADALTRAFREQLDW